MTIIGKLLEKWNRIEQGLEISETVRYNEDKKDFNMDNIDIKQLNEELKLALNEMAQIGQSFNGNHKVQVISGDHNAHYLKDNKILYKFKRPNKCPKSLADIEELEDFKASNCTDKELNILVDWFSRDYVTLKGKTIKGQTNFERLDDEFEAQNAVINQKTQAVNDATN